MILPPDQLLIGKQIINSVSAYVPHVGLSAEEKDGFWDTFIIVLSAIPCRRYGDVHGGMAFGTRNAEGERIVEFGDAVGIGGVQHILQEGRL